MKDIVESIKNTKYSEWHDVECIKEYKIERKTGGITFKQGEQYEASKYSFNKNHNQIENVYIDDYQNTEFYKKYNRLGPEHIDVIYGLKDNDMLLWISDIKGNTIYLKYTKYSEIE